MEQVLERESKTKERKIYDWRDIEMYDDEGRRITNPKTLRSFAEGQEIIAEWERRVERYHLDEKMRKYYEEDDDIDGNEKEE